MASPPASPRKIAYILKMFPRFSETFILSEILELERIGTDLHIFSLKQPNDARRHADVEKVQAPVIYLPEAHKTGLLQLIQQHSDILRLQPKRYLKTAAHALRRRHWGAIKRFLQAGYIAPYLQREGITHVHAHFASSATSVARFVHELTGIGYSFTAHAKDIYIDSVSSDVLTRKMTNARFVVTVSDYNKVHLSSLASDVPIVRVYNGLDLTQFAPNGTRPTEGTPLILGVGRLVEKKGFNDLIRACAILRDRHVAFHCKIVGTGNEEAKLRALIEELGLRGFIDLAGPMPREELISLYPQASVFVAPCVIGNDGNRDGLPTVLIEAMALGIPVVSTHVTGIPEIVRHEETGQLVSPSAPNDLALAIERVLVDRTWAGDMAKRGRLLVEDRFDLRRNVVQLRDLFQGAS